LVPKRKAKVSFFAFFFSIKICYGEISSRIHAAAAVRRKRRRSKFPNPNRGQKSVILSVTENVWPPCPALPCPTLPYPALPCPCPAR